MDAQNKFIVLEGIDGVGKSTILTLLAAKLRELGISVAELQGLCQPFCRIGGEVIELESVEARYFFYLASNLVVSSLVKRTLRDQWVLCDRYVFSTQAYHLARGLRHAVNLDEVDVIYPHFGFMIVVPDEELRQQRIERRGTMTKDDKERRLPDSAMSRIEELYSSFGLTKIDNSNSDPSFAVNAIINTIFSQPRGQVGQPPTGSKTSGISRWPDV
jgi:thymidylate kinase